MNRTESTYRLWIQGAEMANVYAKVSSFVRVIELVDALVSDDGKIITVVDITTALPFDTFAEISLRLPGLDSWAYLPSLDEVCAS